MADIIVYIRTVKRERCLCKGLAFVACCSINCDCTLRVSVGAKQETAVANLGTVVPRFVLEANFYICSL